MDFLEGILPILLAGIAIVSAINKKGKKEQSKGTKSKTKELFDTIFDDERTPNRRSLFDVLFDDDTELEQKPQEARVVSENQPITSLSQLKDSSIDSANDYKFVSESTIDTVDNQGGIVSTIKLDSPIEIERPKSVVNFDLQQAVIMSAILEPKFKD